LGLCANGQKIRITVQGDDQAGAPSPRLSRYITEPIGSPAFAAAYADAIRKLDASPEKIENPLEHAKPGTLGWLASKYFKAPKFTKLDKTSQLRRRSIIEGCLREPPNPDSKTTLAQCPLSKITPSLVMMVMDRKADSPGAANNRKRHLSTMFTWGVRQKHLTSNPCREVEKVEYATEGFYTWTVEDVRRFESHWAIGTKPRH
jgi:hypothetical protein